ncbi:MAG: hypothetical protein ABI476_09250 [Oxalobacteraceae bacterium]
MRTAGSKEPDWVCCVGALPDAACSDISFAKPHPASISGPTRLRNTLLMHKNNKRYQILIVALNMRRINSQVADFKRIILEFQGWREQGGQSFHVTAAI